MSAEQHLDVEWWPIDRPTPYAKNPRKLGKCAVAKVAASLQEFGWRQPVVVDEQGVILVGHTRLLAAKSLGQEQVPVHVARGLTGAQAKAYRIADNRTAAENEWDLELLPLEIADLKAMDADLALLGFEGDELTALLAGPPTAGLTDPDAAPEPPAAPTSRSGDLWLPGGHRLLCGDATRPDDVRRLMDGKRAVGMFTDPPYLVDYNASHHPQSHANDPLAKDRDWDAYEDPETSVAFYADFLRVALQEALSERAAIYQCFAILRSEIIWQAWRALDLLPHQVVIWHKSRGVLTHSWYLWDYEPLLIGWRAGKQPEMKPPANATTVWEIDSKIEDNPGSIHPTMKPVELIRRPILYHTKPGGLIYEPFSGSGTALIAAEATGRICNAIELSPAFVDVALLRWQNFSGGQATLAGDGRSFAEVAAERRG